MRLVNFGRPWSLCNVKNILQNAAVQFSGMALVMMGSTSLLGDFEHQYSVQTAEITARIGRLASLEKNERVEGIGQIQRLLADVENLLEQMELAVREFETSRCLFV